MSIYTHPKIAALRKVEAQEREVRLAKAVLESPPGQIQADGRGRKEWARKTLLRATRSRKTP